MLDAEGGCYTLGSPSPHHHTYILSLTLDNPCHLPQVCLMFVACKPCCCQTLLSTHTHTHTQPPSADKQLYFCYCLLGNDITSEPFSPPSFHPERASIRVCAKRETLGLFLAAQDELQVSGTECYLHSSSFPSPLFPLPPPPSLSPSSLSPSSLSPSSFSLPLLLPSPPPQSLPSLPSLLTSSTGVVGTSHYAMDTFH